MTPRDRGRIEEESRVLPAAIRRRTEDIDFRTVRDIPDRRIFGNESVFPGTSGRGVVGWSVYHHTRRRLSRARARVKTRNSRARDVAVRAATVPGPNPLSSSVPGGGWLRDTRTKSPIVVPVIYVYVANERFSAGGTGGTGRGSCWKGRAAWIRRRRRRSRRHRRRSEQLPARRRGEPNEASS